MGIDHAARRRMRAPPRSLPPPASAVQAGAHVSLGELLALERAARDFSFLPRQPVHSLLAGRHGSRVRGRGLSFEELRPYVLGDDLRSMDWRVTARAGAPYVRVYSEERDRPTLVVVDQRLNMFFGTRRAMKSVTAAEIAALVAWRALEQGDRTGGILLDDGAVEVVRPARGRGAVVRLLETLARRDRALRADAPARRNPAQLDAALEAAARVAAHDHLVVIASDLDGAGDRTCDALLRLALHNDVVAGLVYDPFLLDLPPAGDLVVSDGELQVELRLAGVRLRRAIAGFVDARARWILGWQEELGIPVLPISAAEDPAAQLRALLGNRPPGKR